MLTKLTQNDQSNTTFATMVAAKLDQFTVEQAANQGGHQVIQGGERAPSWLSRRGSHSAGALGGWRLSSW